MVVCWLKPRPDGPAVKPLLMSPSEGENVDLYKITTDEAGYLILWDVRGDEPEKIASVPVQNPDYPEESGYHLDAAMRIFGARMIERERAEG